MWLQAREIIYFSELWLSYLTQCSDASQQCAQVLLTLDNLADRNQYINASNTFQQLFQMGTIPIVNENDTVAVQQLRFGDNDTLSAEVNSASFLSLLQHHAVTFSMMGKISLP